LSHRFHVAARIALWLVAACPALGQPLDAGRPQPRIATKEGTVASQLLLPFYAVDTLNPAGLTTLWAIRNESTSQVAVRVRYYGADRPQLPQSDETVLLGPKAVKTVNVGLAVQPLDLQIDPDGFARGYVTFSAGQGEAVIHGDYFLLDDAESFASGSRLVNIDPSSNGNDLCNRFSMRFLDSSLLFDSGTVYTVWIQADAPITGDAFSYFVYPEAGGDEVLSSGFPATDVAFQVSANLLRSVDPQLDLEFGAIEFQFPGQTVGHISAVMSAFGRFSVGYEATCLDPT